MRYRLSQNFKQKIVLQLNKDDEYSMILDRARKKRPSKIFGRGLIPIDDEIYEFQTDKICLPEEHNFYIKEEIEKLKKVNTFKAPDIPILPKKVTFKDVSKSLKDLKQVPIGIMKRDLKIASYDFKNNFLTIITSKNSDEVIDFTENLIEEIKKLEDINRLIFNMEKAKQKDKNQLKEKYVDFLKYLNANKENKEKHIVIIFIGIDKFLTEIDSSEGFSKMLKISEEGNYSFIIVENSTKLKNHTYDLWYKNYISGDTGIWVGNGFDDQYLISINGSRRGIINNCGRSFGYMVKAGKPIMIKLLEMKEKSDDDE